LVLNRAIESLSPGYRIIFVLHDVEGYEHGEIAELLGCSIGNTKSQLHKARMKLRAHLSLPHVDLDRRRIQREAAVASGRRARAASAA
jgi:DNA-directed RNA polymerase specialized sigma24 family protein